MASVSGAIARLKLAAIDAAMRQRDYVVAGDNYVFRPMGKVGIPGSVTRPGLSGGGGVVLSVPLEHPRSGASAEVIAEQKQHLASVLAEEFAAIRHAIDSSIEPWLEIPKPENVLANRSGCDALVVRLMGAVVQTGSSITGAGELGARLERVKIESESFGGGAFDDFKKRFVDETPMRATRLTALGEVIGQAVTAEAEIWKRVTEVDLPGLLETYVEGFEDVAQAETANPSVTFSVVSAAVAGAALFATGPTAIAIAGAGVVIGLLESLSNDTKVNSGEERRLFGDVEGGLADFSASLSELSARIGEQERAVASGIGKTITEVRAQADLFQLAPAPIASASANDTMYATPQKNLSLARTFLPLVGEETAAVAGIPGEVSAGLRNALMRPYSIGGSVAGAANRVTDLANLLTELLKEFAWDIDNGSRNLEYAILDWAQTDEQAGAASRALAAEIGEGTTHRGRPADELLDIPQYP